MIIIQYNNKTRCDNVIIYNNKFALIYILKTSHTHNMGTMDFISDLHAHISVISRYINNMFLF